MFSNNTMRISLLFNLNKLVLFLDLTRSSKNPSLKSLLAHLPLFQSRNIICANRLILKLELVMSTRRKTALAGNQRHCGAPHVADPGRNHRCEIIGPKATRRKPPNQQQNRNHFRACITAIVDKSNAQFSANYN